MNIIDDFNLTFTTINDIDIFDSNIYIATDNGLLVADYINNENVLYASSSWSSLYVGNNILSINEG